jgi:hypothetical protein
VTLTRLVLAWLPVAVLFVVLPPDAYRYDATTGRRYFVWTYNPWEVGWRAAEAAVVTLFGALWFDSLGAGGWWLLFFLVGVLVGFPLRLALVRRGDVPRRVAVVHGCCDVARYVAAGGLLAWRLG